LKMELAEEKKYSQKLKDDMLYQAKSNEEEV
jgi:hypothetical protein